MTEILHNVTDRRHGWIGSWEIAPLEIDKLTEADTRSAVKNGQWVHEE